MATGPTVREMGGGEDGTMMYKYMVARWIQLTNSLPETEVRGIVYLD